MPAVAAADRLAVRQALVGLAGLIGEIAAPALHVFERGPADLRHLAGALDGVPDIHRGQGAGIAFHFFRQLRLCGFVHGLQTVVRMLGFLGLEGENRVLGKRCAPAFCFRLRRGSAGVFYGTDCAAEGVSERELIILAALGIDQHSPVRGRFHVVALHALGKQAILGVEAVIKEAARGPDQPAARGHEAPKALVRAERPKRAGGKRKLLHRAVGQEDQTAAIDQIELAERAGAVFQIDGLGPGCKLIADEVKALAVHPGKVKHAVLIVQPRGLPGINGRIAPVGIVDQTVVADVEQAVFRSDHRAAGKHVGGEGAKRAGRIGLFRRAEDGSCPQQHQARQDQGGQFVQEMLHGQSSQRRITSRYRLICS